MAHTYKTDVTGQVPILILRIQHCLTVTTFPTSPQPMLPHACYIPSTLNYLHASKRTGSWTPRIFANAMPLPETSFLTSWSVEQAPKCFPSSSWIKHRAPGCSPEDPATVGRGGDLFLRMPVHWVLESLPLQSLSNYSVLHYTVNALKPKLRPYLSQFSLLPDII